MAKQTAAQKKAAAAKRAAATKTTAPKSPAGETQTNAGGGATQTDVSTANAPAPPNAGSGDGATQTDVTQGDSTTQTNAGTGGGEDQTPAPTLSIFDQAMAFIAPKASDTEASEARDLWDQFHCDHLPAKLAVAVLDCAIHQGAKPCERMLGKVGIEHRKSDFDPAIHGEIDAGDVDGLVQAFLAWRLRRYAFTAMAATKMLEWAQHILALQALELIEAEA